MAFVFLMKTKPLLKVVLFSHSESPQTLANETIYCIKHAQNTSVPAELCVMHKVFTEKNINSILSVYFLDVCTGAAKLYADSYLLNFLFFSIFYTTLYQKYH